MTALPNITQFNGSTTTQGDQKSFMADLIAFLTGTIGTAGTQAAALTALGTALNGVLSKAANYPVVAADRGKLIDYTAAPYTLTLPTVAMAGAGFVTGARNSAASGTLTVGRNSANIDGAAADLTLNPGESCLIVCDGTGWKTVGRATAPEYGVLLGAYGCFTSGSSLTATRPAGATKARIMVQGGGGAATTASSGGSGAYAEAVKAVTGDLTVTVGAAAGASSVSGAGFTTITAAGGASGGAGGTLPTTGDINLAGISGISGQGKPGGGGLYSVAGHGGNPANINSTGTAGAYGGGGGSPGYDSSGSLYGGVGAGSQGFVIIYWYK